MTLQAKLLRREKIVLDLGTAGSSRVAAHAFQAHLKMETMRKGRGCQCRAPCEKQKQQPFQSLFSRVAEMPDLLAAIIGDQQAAVRHLQQGYGAAPDFPLIRTQHPAGEKLARRSRWLGILERNKRDRLADS